jgi:hypothetical protein
MTALSWLNDLIKWLGRWVPRLVLIEPTHRGVKFGPRGSATECGPGLVVYWPITHALVQIPVTTQSIYLTAQVLPILGDTGIIPRVLVCASAIQYRVVSPVTTATRALHLHAIVDNRTQAAIARNADHRDDRAEWSRRVILEVREELRPFGIEVERIDFTSQGTGMVLKNIADWNYTDAAAGTRPS